MDVDGNYQAKVMINGETKVVPIHKDSPVKPTSSAIADKYVTYEVKDGAYKFTEITSSDSGLWNILLHRSILTRMAVSTQMPLVVVMST